MYETNIRVTKTVGGYFLTWTGAPTGFLSAGSEIFHEDDFPALMRMIKELLA